MLYYIGKCVKNVMRLKAKDKKFLLASAVKIAVFAGIGAAAGAGSLRYSIILQQRQNQALLAQAIQAPPEKKNCISCSSSRRNPARRNRFRHPSLRTSTRQAEPGLFLSGG